MMSLRFFKQHSDNKVLNYRLPSTDRTTVNQWFDDLLSEVMACPPERRMLTLVDLRGAGQASDAVSAARRLAAIRPNLDHRMGILLDNHITSRVLSLPARANKVRVFYSEEQARRWLV